jgi:hypothetical protein
MQRHPGEISPGEPFDVFYFLRNPLDSATYYVRAKIYDVRTGEVLITTALAQSSTNPRLFSATVQAPPDSSAYGRNILAIASVYTDSGFTSQSNDYEEQEQYFLVRAAVPFMGGGGVDYRVIEDILDAKLDEKLKALPKPPSLPDMPWDSLFGAIGVLQREINRVPKDQQDLAPLHSAIAGVHAAVQALPAPEKPDLSVLVEAINHVLLEVSQLRDLIRQTAAAGTSASETAIKSAIQRLGATLLDQVESGLKDLMGRQELTIPFRTLLKEPASATPSPMDVSHLM